MIDLPAILEDLPLAVWVGKVPDGTTAYSNRACAQILGRPLGDPLPIAEHAAAYGLVTRDGKPYPVDQTPFARVVRTAGPVMVDDMMLRRRDGDVYIRAFASPAVDARGVMTDVIVAFLDISNEIAAQ